MKIIFGKDCVVEDFAVIGSPPKDYEMDEIESVNGDNAFIRSHTVIYAGNKIGNNFQTVPSNAVVVGNPGRIISHIDKFHLSKIYRRF